MTISLSDKGGGGVIPPFFNEAGKFPGYRTGKYYIPTMYFENVTNAAIGTSNLYYTPFVPLETYTFKGLAYYQGLTGNAGSGVRMGIYSSDNTGGPDSLIVAATEIILPSGTGLRVETISQELIKDILYYIAVTTSISATTIRRTSLNMKIPPMNQYGSRAIDISALGYDYRYMEAFAYAPLPATANPLTTTQKPPISFLEG